MTPDTNSIVMAATPHYGTVGDQTELKPQLTTYENTVAAAPTNVSDRYVPVAGCCSPATFCSLPQCDMCLALLQLHQISLVPTLTTSCANSVRSQLDNSSHGNSQYLNKIVYSQQQQPQPPVHHYVYSCPPTSVNGGVNNIAMDPHRKISILSNQSTMSTDSDYVSDASYLCLDGRTRKLSDVQNHTEIPSSVEMFHYTKPASCNLNLNLSTAKMNVKDQSCQTPDLPVEGQPKAPDFQAAGAQTSLPMFECGENLDDDPKRKISNISTNTTLSSLSTDSASTFDTVAEILCVSEDTRDEESICRKSDTAVSAQVSETVRYGAYA